MRAIKTRRWQLYEPEADKLSGSESGIARKYTPILHRQIYKKACDRSLNEQRGRSQAYYVNLSKRYKKDFFDKNNTTLGHEISKSKRCLRRIVA